AAQEPPLLGLHVRRRPGALVEIAVMGDLVAGVPDRANAVRPAFGAVARDEERRAYAGPIEQAQQTGHRRSRAVFLVAHDVEPARRLRMVEQDRALGVDVEREARRGAIAVRPREA